MYQQLIAMKVGDKIHFGSGRWSDQKREKLEKVYYFVKTSEPSWQFQVVSDMGVNGLQASEYLLERIR